MCDERWLPVVGYEGRYEVSSLGRVKSVERVVPHAKRGSQGVPGKILRQKVNATGYMGVNLYSEGERWSALVHRLVAFAFLGDPDPGEEVCHFDGDRTNNRVDNLRWDTRRANALDAIRHRTTRNQHAGKTHCKRGHEFSAVNTHVAPSGKRSCRACGRERSRRYYRAAIDAL